ncbi:malto-oligosyltrehalose trehalohydrolase [Tundrisphaera sp. TA3]|uniref:malto-oligosyltrehalose trehalohydrolase n=1 Tax=Tundrisphaera sp. TA3 TaxID=3435775 RepID=UPI003EB9CE6B
MAIHHVWAPTAQSVEITINGERFPMTLDPEWEGWWATFERSPRPGDDYAYSVDGGPERPDPRSMWQPHGVAGPSRVVDHSAFRWSDEGFQARPLSSAVIYELHIGTFTPEGTFDSAIGRLDHLKELGITHVEIMPVADFPGNFGWGYDGVSLYAPKNEYGGPDGLKRLVDACHARGLAVVLDVVYNHFGPSGNFLAEFGPYFTDRHKTPWGSALNFDGPYSDEVRRFFCDNALMWLRDYHFDGLRLDAVHAIVDTSAIHFLEQLANEVDVLKAHLGRHLILIAESDLNDPRVVRPFELGGFGIDAQWSDDFHHALHSAITGEVNGYYSDFGSLSDLATAFKSSYVYSGQVSKYRLRRHGRPPIGLSGHHFLGYVQNHDQLGNRAQGDRLCHLTTPERAKMAAALVLTSPFVPMLFQGEEFRATAPFQYFADFSDDPDLSRAVSEGRCKEFGQFGWRPEDVPDPASPETYQRSKLDWSEVDHDLNHSLYRWHRDLIRLRRSLPQLTDGRLDLVGTRFDEEEKWLVIERGLVSIVTNFSDEPRAVPIRDGFPTEILLSSADDVSIVPTGVMLPGNSVAILGPSTDETAQALFRSTIEAAAKLNGLPA